MPKGVYPRTIETRIKIAEAKMGDKNPMKRPEVRLKMSMSRKGIPAWNKGLCDEKSNFWKGDNIGYRGIHQWVKKHLGNPQKCSHCETTKGNHFNFHWANINHTYKRELTDWIRLCAKCHSHLDRGLINL